MGFARFFGVRNYRVRAIRMLIGFPRVGAEHHTLVGQTAPSMLESSP